MRKNSVITLAPQRGFTLVELAVVMTIVAVLIGGVLKGQEMIYNAQIVNSGMRIKAIEAATRQFRDFYKNLPGDMANGGTRLKDCAGACASNGDEDDWIDATTAAVANGIVYGANDEPNRYWLHLKAAGLLGEVPTAAADGVTYMNLPINSPTGFLSAYSYKYAASFWFANELSGRYWFGIVRRPSTAPGYDVLVNRFALYDTKFDDGKPSSGDALVNGSTCGVAAGAVEYDPANLNICVYLIRAHF